ncbi:MAG: tail fiber protein [Saprospiraceae bacterium]|nr:tail fiber protein [Saprospiraceae bacterium]
MEPFIGMIVMFGGNFAPRNWALCEGQLLAISQNTALFSILGTTYGGDGRTSFGLPDLRGRVAMHPGHGPGLTPRRLGEKSGFEQVVLNTTQIPSHTHTLNAAGSLNVVREDGNTAEPAGAALANVSPDTTLSYNNSTAPDATAANNSVTVTGNANPTGGSQGHTNMQPYTCVNYLIALFGTFPSRN